MTYDWNTMVPITVPVGLNGWYFSGEVTINGVKATFPVGKPTTVPEPVAEMLKAMIKAATPNTANPHYEPHKMYVTDENGDPVWTDLLAYKTTGTVELLAETVLPFLADEPGSFVYQSPLAALPENGKTYKVTYNGEVRETPCLVISADGLTVAILGSGFMFSLENDEDAPFGIAIPMDDATAESMGGIHLLYVGKEEFTGDLTLSITGEATTIKRIDPEYLSPLITLTIGDDGTVTSDTDFATAWAMTAAQLQAAITVKDTGFYLGSGAARSKGALAVTKYENTLNDTLWQEIRIKWQAPVPDESDIGMDTSTKVLRWSSDGITDAGVLVPGLPIAYGLNEGMYLRYNGERWIGVDIDQLKADLGVYELIEKVTIEEAETLRFLRDSEPDGTPYKFNSVYVRVVTQPLEKAVTGYIYLYGGNSLSNRIMGGYVANMSNTSERTSTFVGMPVYNRWFAFSFGAGNDNGNSANVANYPSLQGMYDTAQFPYITNLDIRQSEAWAIGATIEIWGVRA